MYALLGSLRVYLTVCHRWFVVIYPRHLAEDRPVFCAVDVARLQRQFRLQFSRTDRAMPDRSVALIDEGAAYSFASTAVVCVPLFSDSLLDGWGCVCRCTHTHTHGCWWPFSERNGKGICVNLIGLFKLAGWMWMCAIGSAYFQSKRCTRSNTMLSGMQMNLLSENCVTNKMNV